MKKAFERRLEDLSRFLNLDPGEFPSVLVGEIRRWRGAPRIRFDTSRRDDAEILQKILVWQKCLQSLVLRIQEAKDGKKDPDLEAGETQEAYELLQNYVSQFMVFRCALSDEVLKSGKPRKSRQYRLRPKAHLPPTTPSKPWPEKWKAMAADALIQNRVSDFLAYLEWVGFGEARRVRRCSKGACERFFLQPTAASKTCGADHKKK